MSETSTNIKIKDFEDLVLVCNSLGISVNSKELYLFKKYYKILLDWNKKINLVSRDEIKKITSEHNPVIEKHFLDSILFLPEIESLIAYRLSLIAVFDIGSGGGFPAIPLAIMKPHWDFILCESTEKKAGFLTQLIKELGLKNIIEVINSRVENINKEKKYTNCFYLVTVRAVAKLDKLIKYSLPLLTKGGFLIAYKAQNIDEEIKNTQDLIKKNDLTVKIFSKEVNNVARKIVVLTPQNNSILRS